MTVWRDRVPEDRRRTAGGPMFYVLIFAGLAILCVVAVLLRNSRR